MRRSPSIFDGKLSRMQAGIAIVQLRFYLRISSFKEWVNTKGNEFKTRFRKEAVVRPLSVGSMIVTSDDKWIIGRRHMDPDKDIVHSKPDPFFAIKREIEEETGISRNQDISSVICLGADGADQPYLAFKTQLKLSYAELKSNIPPEKSLER